MPAIAGCRAHHILSIGHRHFVTKFIASFASASADCAVFFEECSGKSLAKNSDRKQVKGSFTFLHDTFQKEVEHKAAKIESLRRELSHKEFQLFEDAEQLQLFDDSELPYVFEKMVEELSVDHALMLCTNLPANHLNAGINVFITFLLDRDQLYKSDDFSQKIFQLIKFSKDLNCSLIFEVRQRLLQWLEHNGDRLNSIEILQLLHEESAKSSPVQDAEDNRQNRKMGLLEVVNQVIFQDNFCKSQLPSIFYDLGKLALTAQGKDKFSWLRRLQLKGMLEDDLKALIDSFTKGLTEVHPYARHIRVAVEVFKRITRQLQLNSVSSCNIMIALCASHGEIQLCVDLIKMMKDSGLVPCGLTYEPLIRFFTTTREISKAEDILRVMQRSGMQATVKSYFYLVRAHARADNLERAFNLLHEIPCNERIAELYSPIIFEYGLKGNSKQALYTLQGMERDGIKPRGESFASLINACAIRKNYRCAEKVFELYRKQGEFSLEEQKLVLAAMLRIYAACGDSKLLEKVLSCTNESLLVSRDVKCSMLQGFAETGSSEQALRMYNRIRDQGSFPSACTLVSLMRSLGKDGEIGQVLSLYEQFKEGMKSRGRVHQELNMSLVCSAVVHALISHNHLEKASTFLQRIQQEDAGDAETLCLKVFMDDTGNDDDPKCSPLALKDKLQFLKGMQERLHIHPTRLAYESLLESCVKEKDVEHAGTILAMMSRDNMPLNVFTCLILLRIVVGRGDNEKTWSLLSEMRKTMQEHGLMDRDVQLLIKNILRSGNYSDLINQIYSD